MEEVLVYGSQQTDRQTFLAMAVVTGLLVWFSFSLDWGNLIHTSAESFNDPWAPPTVVLLWRITCAGVGIGAVVSMFRIGAGTMQVLMHEDRTMKILAPVGREKFVTFSSWTLVSNILYFSSAGAASFLGSIGNVVPLWLEAFQTTMFAIACGSAFLTAAVVRHVILPGLFQSDRSSDFIFKYHEQMMHNYSAIFLAVEMVLVVPKLQPELALICVGMGLFYVFFAYVNAYHGSGFYVYSFIDPRRRYAPFVMIALAAAIAVFYVCMYLVSLIAATNLLVAALILTAWVSLIVQFSPTQDPDQSSS
ncbi:MAG: hypothetical protein OSA38_05600 [Candidatus Poseidoniaceae archaeon]|nr:hypothetical protein [Candidatus Poseidoniaceae archaeon]